MVIGIADIDLLRPGISERSLRRPCEPVDMAIEPSLMHGDRGLSRRRLGRFARRLGSGRRDRERGGYLRVHTDVWHGLAVAESHVCRANGDVVGERLGRTALRAKHRARLERLRRLHSFGGSPRRRLGRRANRQFWCRLSHRAGSRQLCLQDQLRADGSRCGRSGDIHIHRQRAHRAVGGVTAHPVVSGMSRLLRPQRSTTRQAAMCSPSPRAHRRLTRASPPT
jgi:hypothetical protein